MPARRIVYLFLIFLRFRALGALRPCPLETALPTSEAALSTQSTDFFLADGFILQ